jgi:hypothetical protein
MANNKRRRKGREAKPSTKPSTPEKGEDAAASAAFIAQHSQLHMLQLVGSSSIVLPEILEIMAKQRSLSLGYNLAVSPVAYDEAQGIASAFFAWRLFGDSLPEEGSAPEAPAGAPKRVIEFVATYLVGYAGIPGQPKAPVAAFVDQVGEFASYPYFRSFVSQLSWASNIPIPILPVISAQRRASRVVQTSVPTATPGLVSASPVPERSKPAKSAG